MKKIHENELKVEEINISWTCSVNHNQFSSIKQYQIQKSESGETPRFSIGSELEPNFFGIYKDIY